MPLSCVGVIFRVEGPEGMPRACASKAHMWCMSKQKNKNNSLVSGIGINNKITNNKPTKHNSIVLKKTIKEHTREWGDSKVNIIYPIARSSTSDCSPTPQLQHLVDRGFKAVRPSSFLAQRDSQQQRKVTALAIMDTCV